MYIMAPINMSSDDYLAYWMSIRSDTIAKIWQEVIAPVEQFVQERFPGSVDRILTAPVKHIQPDVAMVYRARAIQINSQKTADDPMSFMDGRMMDNLYVTEETPKPPVYNGLTDQVLVGQKKLVNCEVNICFVPSPDMKTLEADIYGFFLAHLCKRLEGLFYKSFPRIHFKNSGATYIATCPDLETATSEMTDKDIARYLDHHLTVLRLENVTFEEITDHHRNRVKNHTRIVSEALIRKNMSFITAIDAARKDGFDIAQAFNAYPPLLPVWLRPATCNVFCAWSIYKNDKLFDEFSMEMYEEGGSPFANRKDDFTLYMHRWFDALDEMNKEPDDAKWTIVMTDLIHM